MVLILQDTPEGDIRVHIGCGNKSRIQYVIIEFAHLLFRFILWFDVYYSPSVHYTEYIVQYYALWKAATVIVTVFNLLFFIYSDLFSHRYVILKSISDAFPRV